MLSHGLGAKLSLLRVIPLAKTCERVARLPYFPGAFSSKPVIGPQRKPGGKCPEAGLEKAWSAYGTSRRCQLACKNAVLAATAGSSGQWLVPMLQWPHCSHCSHGSIAFMPPMLLMLLFRAAGKSLADAGRSSRAVEGVLVYRDTLPVTGQ